MKKIWPWLLLLLLLIIFCVWSKKDSIHLSKDTHSQHVVSPKIEEVRYIEYALIQNDANHYSLNGKFATTKQEERFKEILSKSRKRLTSTHTSTNEKLHGEPAVELTAKILPHFAQHYSKGKIVYTNQKLTITGTADSYEAQHEMQRLLNTSTLPSSDESNVIANQPIEYTIHKNQQKVHVEGIFNDAGQVNQIKRHLPVHATTNFQIKKHHTDNGSLNLVASFLPTFFSKYTKGDIVYNKEKITITGNVHSQEELDEIAGMLSHASIPINNHTIVDPDILAQAAERARLLAQKEKAKQAALAEEKAKQAKQAKQTEAEAQRQAKEAKLAEQAARIDAKQTEEARRKAEAAAAEKARIEAYKAREEAKRAEEKRRAEAARLAQERRRAEVAKEAEMKRKIANLFKLENIEFNVNKSTLTDKGQNTVNKLARILKEYPSVRIEIAGHTDSDGSAEYNQKLSQSRVDTVRTKLIAQAIKSTRLVAKGYGEAQPLVPNNSRANKAKNRRVEINILGE